MAQDIRIITTGGTFDKQYDAIKGELTFNASQLPRILGQARCTLSVVSEGPVAIDSLYMTENQRHEIAESVRKSSEKRVVVVHGTDTMVNTAKVVAERLGEDDGHVVVFTGAMVPFALEYSDAIFNLGCAMTAVQLLDPGVYVAMSGRIFPYDKVIKNKDKGLFESIG